MTTLAQATEAILERWDSQWGATTVWTTDNETAFDPPVGASWARIVLRHAHGPPQETIGPVGARKFLRQGIVLVQIYAPTGSGGRATADSLAQQARAVFEAVRLTAAPVWFYGGVIREIGNVQVLGRWFQINVEIVFNYEEQK